MKSVLSCLLLEQMGNGNVFLEFGFCGVRGLKLRKRKGENGILFLTYLILFFFQFLEFL